MTSRLALLLLVLLPLAACKKDAPAAVDATQPGSAATAPAAQQASVQDAATSAAAEAAMRAAEEAAAKAPPPVAGVDYVEIPNGQPFDTTDGRIEIAEFFGYVCPFGAMWDNYAKAYYTAEAMGLVEQTHDAMFRAIHIDKTLKGERGMDTPEEIAAFYAAYGADPKQFVSSMQSFAVAAKINRAKQYIVGAFANGDSAGTPTFIVNGKYRVKGKSTDDMFRVLNQLVVAERAKRGAAAPAAAAAPTPEAPVAAPAQQ